MAITIRIHGPTNYVENNILTHDTIDKATASWAHMNTDQMVKYCGSMLDNTGGDYDVVYDDATDDPDIAARVITLAIVLVGRSGLHKLCGPDSSIVVYVNQTGIISPENRTYDISSMTVLGIAA